MGAPLPEPQFPNLWNRPGEGFDKIIYAGSQSVVPGAAAVVAPGWELTRNASSRVPPHTSQIRNPGVGPGK